MTADSIIVAADSWRMHGDGSGWWMGGMMIWMVVFWAAVILGIVWIARGVSDRRLRRSNNALDILERRFAEGAITFDDYSERKAVLTGKRDPRGQESKPSEGKGVQG
jgi:putative membrane protein